jgi:glycosyltransferase involved in cell wall biosynthesis
MITEGNNKKVVILAFNLGITGGLVNGPGISLRNLLLFVKTFYPNVSFSVFTKYPVTESLPGLCLFSMKDNIALREEIRSADAVHCWSGLKNSFFDAIKVANSLSKPVILGPNLLDSVNFNLEKKLLAEVNFDMLLVVNPRLKYLLAKLYNLDHSRVKSFMVGPDLSIWKVPKKVDKYILWKGNARQPVKDIRFARRVAKRLPGYEFRFLGYNKSFDYMSHVPVASHARLYINTSLSETKGMAQLEQMAAGVPSVVHPKIYSHGENYVTGIITNKTIDNYVGAIKEILEDNSLRQMMRLGAREYVEKHYNPIDIARKYWEILEDVC